MRFEQMFREVVDIMSNGYMSQSNVHGLMATCREVYSSLLQSHGIDHIVSFESEESDKLSLRCSLDSLDGGQVELVAHAIISWELSQRVLLATVKSLDAFEYSTSNALRPVSCVFTQHPNATVPKRSARGLKHLATACENYLLGGALANFKNVFLDVLNDSLNSLQLVQGSIHPVDNLKNFLELYGETLWNLYHLPLELRCWFGVDMDGSSSEYINRDGILSADRVLRNFAIEKCQQHLREGVSLLRYGGELDHRVARRLASELDSIHDSLEATRRGLRGVKIGDLKSYQDESDFVEDVNRLAATLDSMPAVPEVVSIKRILQIMLGQIERYGFYFLEFQPRLNANSVDPLIEQIYAAQCQKTLPEDEQARQQALKSVMESPPSVDLASLHTLSDVSNWIIECLQAFSDVQSRRCGVNSRGRCQSLHSFVLANFERNSTILGLHWILSWFGVEAEIIGLLESHSALSRAGSLFSEQVSLADFQGRAYVNFQGGSDTMRTNGMLAGWWLLYKAQCNVRAISEEIAQDVEQYYGRADHPARWGGSLARFLKVQPSGKGRVHFLLQGSDKLERLVSYSTAEKWYTSLCESCESVEDILLDAENQTFMEALATDARTFFTETVYSEHFPLLMRRTMLFDVDVLRASARPLARGTAGVAAEPSLKTWESRRAISTIQAGVIAGYVFQLMGTGNALQQAIDRGELERLQRLYRDSEYFKYVLDQILYLYGQVDIENFVKLGDGLEEHVLTATFEAITRDTELALDSLEKITGKAVHSDSGMELVSDLRSAFVEMFRCRGWRIPQSERDSGTPSPMSALAVALLTCNGTSG